MIRFFFRFTSILFIAALTAAFFTNPEKDDFSRMVKERVESELSDQLNNPTLSEIAKKSQGFFDTITESLVVRDNYYFFSIFTIDFPTGSYRYLGIFGQIIPLQKENPLEIKAGEQQ